MTRIITLQRHHVTYVDDQDYPVLSRYRWHLTPEGYAKRNIWDGRRGKNKQIFMHRQIMGYPAGKAVDHINQDKLDNRRDNLRVCEQPVQNTYNKGKRRGEYTSQYKGVHWRATPRRWVAVIKHEGVSVYLGRFTEEARAALAYDRAARQYHGEYACLNFPDHSDYGGLPTRESLYSSGFYGVSWAKSCNLWMARIVVNYETIHAGCFDDELEAALARDALARKTPGFKGKLNFSEVV